jgi:hypothetical protein
MFGFSLSKLLFTAVMIAVVWWICRKINMISGGEPRSKPRVNKTQDTADETSNQNAEKVEDLTACPSCGAYVATGLNPGCGRAPKDCPMQA